MAAAGQPRPQLQLQPQLQAWRGAAAGRCGGRRAPAAGRPRGSGAGWTERRFWTGGGGGEGGRAVFSPEEVKELRREIRRPAAGGGCGLAGLVRALYPDSEVAEASDRPRGGGCEAGGGSGPGSRSLPAAWVGRAAALPSLAAPLRRRS